MFSSLWVDSELAYADAFRWIVAVSVQVSDVLRVANYVQVVPGRIAQADRDDIHSQDTDMNVEDTAEESPWGHQYKQVESTSRDKYEVVSRKKSDTLPFEDNNIPEEEEGKNNQVGDIEGILVCERFLAAGEEDRNTLDTTVEDQAAETVTVVEAEHLVDPGMGIVETDTSR
jgi:hypothetical protein